MNSVARLAGTLTLVMIASAVVLGSTQNFSVPDDVALRIRLDDTLTSVDSEVGEPFSPTVVERGDYQNARVYGHISEIDPSGKLTGHASVMLRFDRLVMPDGRRAPIHAETVELYHAPLGEKVDVEGAIESGGQGRKSVEHTVIGAGAGALLGGILRRRKEGRHRFDHRRCGRTGNHRLPGSSEDHAQQRPGNVNSNHEPPILSVAPNRRSNNCRGEV